MTYDEVMSKIPSYVRKVGSGLVKSGYKAYLVGGCVRDILLGRGPADFDIATDAKPENVLRIFTKAIATGAKFGTIVVLEEDEKGESFPVEVTTFRSEEDYVGGRWPSKVEFTDDFVEDLSRRDFTINAMGVDLDYRDDHDEGLSKSPSVNSGQVKSKSKRRGWLIDPFGGQKDLRGKLIRAVGDPVERLKEDGLRGYRACRLAANLSFDVDTKLREAIKETLEIADQVSRERIRDELVKLVLKSPKPSVGLRLMKETGLLKLIIPELLEGEGVEQPEEYHVFPVLEHAFRAVDVADDSVKFAALFHDIAKPRQADGKGHFYGHDIAGAEMTKEVMKRLRFSKREIDRTVRLVRWHMFFYPQGRENGVENGRVKLDGRAKLDSDEQKKKSREQAFKQGWTDSAIRRFIKNVGGEEAIDDLVKLRIADATANPKSSFDPREIEALEKRIAEVRKKDMAIKVTDLRITGHDLAEVGIERGPEMGRILRELLDKVIDDPSLNTKEKLLEIVEEMSKSKIPMSNE